MALTRLMPTNSTANSFSQMPPRITEPGTVMDTVAGALEPGVVSLSAGGSVTPAYIWFQPFCEGPAGSAFYMNVWGWNTLGTDASRLVWAPFFLVQLYCSAGNLPGPAVREPISPRLMRDTENLCDTIFPTLGTLGSGQFNSPGLDYAAWVKVDLQRAQNFSVEFAGDGTVGMNAFWRPIQ